MIRSKYNAAPIPPITFGTAYHKKLKSKEGPDRVSSDMMYILKLAKIGKFTLTLHIREVAGLNYTGRHSFIQISSLILCLSKQVPG